MRKASYYIQSKMNIVFEKETPVLVYDLSLQMYWLNT